MASQVNPAALVTRRTRVLLRQLPAALEGDAAALHRTRVASRRLRELLPLLATAPGKARRRVRKLTRALGRVRELDVALQLLEAEEMVGAAPRRALLAARQHLREERHARREAMLSRLQKLNLKKFERRLVGLTEAAADEDPAAWRRALATRLTRRASRLGTAITDAGAIYVPERLHAVRLAAKQLRYALEIAGEAGVGGAASLAALVRRSQMTLGALQDRTVLLREVQDAAERAADPVTRRGLLTLAAALEEAARALHARYLTQRDDLAAALAAVRQQMVPDLAAGRRAPLKTSLRSARRDAAAGRSARR
jgi:CHAD domain-containing protein